MHSWTLHYALWVCVQAHFGSNLETCKSSAFQKIKTQYQDCHYKQEGNGPRRDSLLCPKWLVVFATAKKDRTRRQCLPGVGLSQVGPRPRAVQKAIETTLPWVKENGFARWSEAIQDGAWQSNRVDSTCYWTWCRTCSEWSWCEGSWWRSTLSSRRMPALLRFGRSSVSVPHCPASMEPSLSVGTWASSYSQGWKHVLAGHTCASRCGNSADGSAAIWYTSTWSQASLFGWCGGGWCGQWW